MSERPKVGDLIVTRGTRSYTVRGLFGAVVRARADEFPHDGRDFDRAHLTRDGHVWREQARTTPGPETGDHE